MALFLAGCTGLGQGGGISADPAPPIAALPSGETIGAGATRVALLLPRSAGGNGAATALAFRNAAELATRDFPNADIQIALYDTGGSPAGAQLAGSNALSEGAQLILGPVFSPEVAAVAPQARQAGVPLVAFSSDASVAAPGVYLLSFLPSDDVDRIVSYAASQGRQSYAAILPANAYGSVAEAAFRRAVAAGGGRIVSIQSYSADPADIASKAKAIAAIAPQADALFMPEAGDAAVAVAQNLSAAGVTREKLRLLGSGQWDDPRILNNPALVGGWFPAPARQGFEEFSRKYQAAYGSVPPRNATLAYDATVLAAGLARQLGNGAPASLLGNPSGFRGVDGVFRFTPGGAAERRLAVYEVTGSGARIAEPAPAGFGAGS
jgi:ABC-type branched-subunit amino acid transport system substrate-binding protein